MAKGMQTITHGCLYVRIMTQQPVMASDDYTLISLTFALKTPLIRLALWTVLTCQSILLLHYCRLYPRVWKIDPCHGNCCIGSGHISDKEHGYETSNNVRNSNRRLSPFVSWVDTNGSYPDWQCFHLSRPVRSFANDQSPTFIFREIRLFGMLVLVCSWCWPMRDTPTFLPFR